MEIDINGGLRVKIDQKSKTASIIKSPKATGKVLIPRFADYENVKYKIISIKSCSFWNIEIESITFPEDSEVETFEEKSFGYSSIKKLQIPPKLKNLESGWHKFIKNCIEIEISPKNNLFTYFDNKFLLGKSDEKSDEFNTLYYMRNDISEVIIPPQVKIIKKEIFNDFKKLKSITFTKNSKLKIMESNVFSGSSIRKLILPSSIEHIYKNCFASVFHLTEIDILPGSNTFAVIDDNNYLVKKSQPNSKNYDVLLFARRDIKNAVIPSYIKVINDYAFSNCNMESIIFEPNSSLEILESFSFTRINGPEKIVFPSSLKEIGPYSFNTCCNVKYIEFHGKSIKIGNKTFMSCDDILSIFFPNANNITLDSSALEYMSKETKFYVRKDVIVSGRHVDKFQKMIVYIDEEQNSNEKATQKLSDKNESKSKKSSDKIESKVENKGENLENLIEKIKKEKNDLERYVCYLQDRLKKFEEIPSIDEFLKKEDQYKNKREKEKEENQTKIMINGEDEKYHQIECKIGEGATSEVYKIKDTRTGQVFCKKVIKESREEELFKTFKNSVKEIEVSLQIRHPCICECLGYNLEEELKKETKKEDDDDDEEEEDDDDLEMKKTTIAIFIEYLPFSVKSLIENKLISNTLKTRIAIEVAFGMKHIHNLGMMHRDLKLENIMLNGLFESKIIDFGLAHAGNLSEKTSSLTKGIGTFAYMSPEMLNEEEYDNKTDVYSYGILLFVLFTGRLPKQSMKERLDKVPLKFPKVSSKISECCIDIIKRCTSFNASKRPSFKEIINDMANNSFMLASEIDTKAIICRYQELNRFESNMK